MPAGAAFFHLLTSSLSQTLGFFLFVLSFSLDAIVASRKAISSASVFNSDLLFLVLVFLIFWVVLALAVVLVLSVFFFPRFFFFLFLLLEE